MSLDPRFLTIHPATSLWWQQRAKCDQCANVLKKAEDGGNTIYRCKLKRVSSPAPHIYCIDMRSPDQPCGPDAALFKKGKKR